MALPRRWHSLAARLFVQGRSVKSDEQAMQLREQFSNANKTLGRLATFRKTTVIQGVCEGRVDDPRRSRNEDVSKELFVRLRRRMRACHQSAEQERLS
jgi:hypothetical protein